MRLRPSARKVQDAMAGGPATAEELAERAGLALPTVKRACHVLTHLKLAMVVDHRSTGTGRHACVYALLPRDEVVEPTREELARNVDEDLLIFIQAAGSTGVRRTEVEARFGLSKKGALHELARLADLGLVDRYWIPHGHALPGSQAAHSRWTVKGVRCRLGVPQ